MSQAVFGDILGQSRAIESLTGAIASGRLHHAWIFHGPLGVGKFTCAIAFARALLTEGTSVEDGVVTTPAGAAGATTLADLHVVTKELARHSDDANVRHRKLMSIPVEVVRERLIAPAALAPSVQTNALAKKVFIVDEAELLNAASQNVTLKTLEEPPAGTVILLVTSNEDRLAATIRSRCQRVGFGPLDDASMRRWVEQAGIDGSPADLAWLVDYSRGSPGLLIEASQAGLAQWAQRLEPMLAQADRGTFEPGLGPMFAELVESWASGWVDRHKADNPSKDAANKAGAARLLDLLSERTRGRLWSAPPGSPEVETALRSIDSIAAAHQRLGANVNLRLTLDNLAAQLAL